MGGVVGGGSGWWQRDNNISDYLPWPCGHIFFTQFAGREVLGAYI